MENSYGRVKFRGPSLPLYRCYKRIEIWRKNLSQKLFTSSTVRNYICSTYPKFGMGLHAMTAVFLLSYLCVPEEAMGTVSNSKSRFRDMERRHHFGGLPLGNDLVIHAKGGYIAKRRQEQFDDYGHMRFGKRGENSEDYGHMRFGKRN